MPLSRVERSSGKSHPVKFLITSSFWKQDTPSNVEIGTLLFDTKSSDAISAAYELALTEEKNIEL